MATRIRDTGLPGWWMVPAIIVITGIVSCVGSNEVSRALHTLSWLCCLLVPGNALVKGVTTGQ